MLPHAHVGTACAGASACAVGSTGCRCVVCVMLVLLGRLLPARYTRINALSVPVPTTRALVLCALIMLRPTGVSPLGGGPVSAG